MIYAHSGPQLTRVSHMCRESCWHARQRQRQVEGETHHASMVAEAVNSHSQSGRCIHTERIYYNIKRQKDKKEREKEERREVEVCTPYEGEEGKGGREREEGEGFLFYNLI